jgi:type I restriction enzyme S subunit
MDGRKWIETTDRYLTKIGVSAVRSSLVPKGAVAVSCIGSDMGKVVMVAKDSVTNQQINSIIVDEARYVPEYIYYVLLPRQKELKDLASGSATPILSKGLFSKVTADVLPLNSQKAIAEILSSLDEKIELNRKQNRTLEAIAQALFKRWFVEFEFPDENGRPYKSSGGAMQPSELGEIPVGWRTGKLEELIGELETGSRPKGGVGMFTDGIPSIGAESITRIGEYDYAKTKHVPEEYFAKMRRGVIKDRDVLIYKDGGTPGRFDVRISMFGGGFPFEAACINEHVFRVQAKKPVYQNYLYLWFSSYPVLEELRHRGAKAAIPGINSNDVKELDFLFMDEVVLEKFDEVIEPLFAKLLRNSREMAALARLRDALLPKLMSGELRVA